MITTRNIRLLSSRISVERRISKHSNGQSTCETSILSDICETKWKRRMNKYQSNNKEELKNILEKKSGSRLVKNLLQSFPNRLYECVRTKAYPTSYWTLETIMPITHANELTTALTYHVKKWSDQWTRTTSRIRISSHVHSDTIMDEEE
jgi:hypothetical protein